VSLVSNALIDGNYYDLPSGLKIPAQMQYSFEKRSK
jgi:hypothetical protein